MSDALLDRITSNAAVCGGRLCIRGMRIRVSDVLEMLATGVGILKDVTEVEGMGSFVIVGDPTGAPVGLWKCK